MPPGAVAPGPPPDRPRAVRADGVAAAAKGRGAVGLRSPYEAGCGGRARGGHGRSGVRVTAWRSGCVPGRASRAQVFIAVFEGMTRDVRRARLPLSSGRFALVSGP
ncbi:hypothetical protein GCM10027073_48120 [Streptomyces chlorus]